MVTSKIDSKDVVVQDEHDPHPADFAGKVASGQTVSGPCKASGQEGDIISQITQSVENLGDGATKQSQVEVLPKSVFGKISLCKLTGAPDTGWGVTCKLLKDSKPYRKKFDVAEVLLSVKEDEFFVLKKKAIVTMDAARHSFEALEYSMI